MTASEERSVIWVRWPRMRRWGQRSRASALSVLLAVVTAIAPLGSGCLSNEYRIPKDELWRVAHLPVEARGQRVRVIQDLGQRRDEAVDPDEYARLGATPTYAESPVISGADAHVFVGNWGPVGYSQNRAVASPPPPPARVAPPVRGVASGRAVAAPVRGTPGGKGGGSGGGGGFNMGGCCGGGGGGSAEDVLVVLAVVVVGAALLATIGLAASEGARFDGYAAVAPEQYVYLKDASGGVTESSLAALTPAQAATAVEATIKDDEGPGLRHLDKAPLDRKGGVFKLDLGTSIFSFGGADLVGPMAHIQAGLFVTRHVGLLVEGGLSGGSDCCVGTIVRHSLALELDVLPLNVGRLHVGLFGKGGVALAGAVGQRVSGPLVGGGALIEFDLTPRLALVLRGGANAAQLDSGWSSAGTITAGLAVY